MDPDFNRASTAFRSAALAAFTLFLAEAGGWAQSPTTPGSSASGPRLLFVIDFDTGVPLAGALVRDLMTRNSMKTSTRGVVGLSVPAFVKRTGALIEVSLVGYERSERVFVDPLADTSAVVIALTREGATHEPLVRDSARRAFVRARTDSTVIQVHVLDEVGPPLPDATIVVSRSDSTLLATSTSDSTGLRTISLPEVSGDVQITVRKLGYLPYVQSARLSAADTFVAPVVLRRIAQVLPVARVVGKRNLYHMDADDIAGSDSVFGDALAAVRRLRPEMFGGRLRNVSGCGTASHIWVNGQLILFPPRDVTPPALPVRPRMVQVGTHVVRGSDGRVRRVPVYKRIPPTGEAAASNLVRSVLAAIKPDHVAEMTYADCFDTTFAKLFTNNAIFVVLKSGIEYDLDRGSRPTKRDSVPD